MKMPGEKIYIDSTASPKLVQKYKQLKKRIKESQDLRNINKINSLTQNKITLKINLGAVKVNKNIKKKLLKLKKYLFDTNKKKKKEKRKKNLSTVKIKKK